MNIITPPKTFWEKVKIIGPGFIWAAAAIGSGELIISAKVGSEYGLIFIWALWLGIWLKYWIQKGILDITILTGRPVVELWHSGKFGKFSSWYWIIFFILTATGVAGLIGLSASILNLLIPILGVNIWAILVTISIILIAYYQKYNSFEKTMLYFCLVLGVGTLLTVILSKPAPVDLISWGLPTTSAAILVFLSLLGWGAGSGPDLMLPYSWWVTEKGYQNLKLNTENGNRQALMNFKDNESVRQIKSWLNFAKWDVIFGYIAAGLVATVFMIAGAEILKPRGIIVDGLPVLKNISTIFTSTFGEWTYLFFMIPAFAAIYSTALGVFDGGRISIAHIARLLTKREPVPAENIRQNKWYRVTLILFSVVPLAIFLGVQRPVFLVIVASVISAISMPLLAWQIFWSLVKKVPKEYRPNKFYLANLFLSVLVYLFFMGQALLDVITK